VRTVKQNVILIDWNESPPGAPLKTKSFRVSVSEQKEIQDLVDTLGNKLRKYGYAIDVINLYRLAAEQVGEI